MAHNLRKLVIQIEEDFDKYRSLADVSRKLTFKGQLSGKIQEARRLLADIQTRGGGIPEKFDDMISTTEITNIKTKLNSIENSLAKDKVVKQ
ncbi:hypothetical protein HOH11_01880 [Candidatus Woesearchaeota archaeon]|jgi:hypothetical protein|nr:hypothetical protein [Candidatus Woesearchaeota archaeon]MBT6023331.1 hypothetical protein [Candidatus Woesearchaeota archaeon]